MTTWSDLLGLVDQVAELLPDAPRPTVLDAECSRQRATRSMLRAFVVPAAERRPRSGVDLVGAWAAFSRRRAASRGTAAAHPAC